MRDDAWEPFERLGAEIKDALESLGIRFITWAPLPGTNQLDRKMCQIVAEIDMDAFKTDDQKATDAQFAEIARAAKADERREEARGLLDQFLISPPPEDGTPPE